ncbi:unnamed protein product [Lactuca saligna]|uniref:Uncharacterized protein n=1 Tax=Lactuca saligna TaxID=75948 RepID=A0AA35VUE2_LACSI|nr:unnamed protein product [Lactuca saligna]
MVAGLYNDLQTTEKKSKKTDVGSSGTKVTTSKSTKQVPVIEPKPIQSKPIIPDTQVSHQGVIFREIPTPASPSSKNQLAADMAKQLSKKKKRRVILTSESTAEEGETVPETLETVLIKYSSRVDTSVITPPEVSIAKTVTVEARISGIPINITDMDTNVIMGEDDSNKATKGNPSNVVSDSFISLPSQIAPIIPITSTIDSPTFSNIISQPFTTYFPSQ